MIFIPGHSKYLITRKGKVYNAKTMKVRKPFKNCSGRLLQNNLSSDKGINKSMQVSRLVALAYIPNPDNHPLVLHKDDNPLNNYYKNLYWGNHQMNCRDKSLNGNASNIIGDKNGMTKYSGEICKKVLRLRAKGKTALQIHLAMGIPKRRVYFIFNGSSHFSRVAQNLQLR